MTTTPAPRWIDRARANCHSTAGAESDVRHSNGRSDIQMSSPAACKAVCLNTPPCNCVTVMNSNNRCWLRRNCDLNNCRGGSADQFTTSALVPGAPQQNTPAPTCVWTVCHDRSERQCPSGTTWNGQRTRDGCRGRGDDRARCCRSGGRRRAQAGGCNPPTTTTTPARPQGLHPNAECARSSNWRSERGSCQGDVRGLSASVYRTRSTANEEAIAGVCRNLQPWCLGVSVFWNNDHYTCHHWRLGVRPDSARPRSGYLCYIKPPGHTYRWIDRPRANCHGGGNGALQDIGSMQRTSSPAACKAACLNTPYCNCVTIRNSNNDCYFRLYCDLNNCRGGDAHLFTTSALG